MSCLCPASDGQTRLEAPLPLALMMTPDPGLPRTPNARNIPPMPRPDVLIPEDLEDEDIDLPLDDEPDTGVADEDLPEEEPDAPQPEEVKRRKNKTGETLPPRPEKQRKQEIDDPVPEPETRRKRTPTLQ